MKNTARGIARIAPVLALVATLLVPLQARAQVSGATDVDINLPSVLVLHYFGNLDISIDGTVLQTWLGATEDQGTASGNGAVSGTTVRTDLDISSDGSFDPTNDPAALPLTLQNAWAVRSLAASGESTRVSISVTDNTLSNSSGATIAMSSATVRQSGGGAFSADTSFSPTGLKNPKLGDVQLTLDLTSATTAGDYLDGVYTITVENL